jgi:hypothetical protein
LKLTPNFVLYGLKGKKKMVKISFLEMKNQARAERRDKIAAIILIVILFSVFLAPNLQIMLFFLFSGLLIGFLHLKRKRRY